MPRYRVFANLLLRCNTHEKEWDYKNVFQIVLIQRWAALILLQAKACLPLTESVVRQQPTPVNRFRICLSCMWSYPYRKTLYSVTEQGGNIKAQPSGPMWDNFDGQYLLQNFLRGQLKFCWSESQFSLSISLILPLPPSHHKTHSLTNILPSKLHLSEYFWKT